MDERPLYEKFSLLGGPLHTLGQRLGLVRDGRTLPLGLALGVTLWLMATALALAEGIGDQFFSLSVIGGHVRLLLAIPLLFLCESMLDPCVNAFVSNLVRSGVVAPSSVATLEAQVARVHRWKNAWPAEAVCALIALAFYWLAPHLNLSGTTAAADPGRVFPVATWSGHWYLVVCLTLFRFVLLRWLWHFGLWCMFLWQLARLELRLIPTHPDGVAGLGYLDVVHTQFITVIAAISAVQAAGLAEDITTGAAGFDAVYPAIGLVLVVNAALFLGPLFFFLPRLWVCRNQGLGDYMGLASTYVERFDRKWLRSPTAAAEPLLGTADLQSLADLGSSVQVVNNMKLVPVSLRMLRDMALAALVPMLPLLLLRYPVAELAGIFFSRLTGL